MRKNRRKKSTSWADRLNLNPIGGSNRGTCNTAPSDLAGCWSGWAVKPGKTLMRNRPVALSKGNGQGPSNPGGRAGATDRSKLYGAPLFVKSARDGLRRVSLPGAFIRSRVEGRTTCSGKGTSGKMWPLMPGKCLLVKPGANRFRTRRMCNLDYMGSTRRC